jgi:ribosomal protein L11 methyltransferase
MPYKEIIVYTNSDSVDILSDAFFHIGVNGVKIDDPGEIAEFLKGGGSWDYIDEKLLKGGGEVKVSGFVTAEECEEKIGEIKNYLLEEYGIAPESLKISAIESEEVNWLEEWKKYYSPIEIGAFAVVPAWIDYKTDKIVVKIDPSTAFGSGEHESTKLCLKFLSGINLKNKTVLDVGCGSGILGIAAAKSGAKRVYMCDLDGLAVKSARENAALNGVSDEVMIEEADLLSKTGLEGDVILANLTADILIRLSKFLPEKCSPSAVLICSGIIHSRKKRLSRLWQRPDLNY